MCTSRATLCRLGIVATLCLAFLAGGSRALGVLSHGTPAHAQAAGSSIAQVTTHFPPDPC